jgi:putative addiction module component (TIGR02574 family)
VGSNPTPSAIVSDIPSRRLLPYTEGHDSSPATTGVLELPTKDRQELAEALWESLKTEAVALPAWQIRLIDARLADPEKSPEEGSSWQEVESRIWPDKPE